MVERIVGCKWSVGLLRLLADGCRRPRAVLRACKGPSAKVLDERLRKRLRYGIASRTVIGGKPPVEVEHVRTPSGRRCVRTIEEIRRLQEAPDRGAIPESVGLTQGPAPRVRPAGR